MLDLLQPGSLGTSSRSRARGGSSDRQYDTTGNRSYGYSDYGAYEYREQRKYRTSASPRPEREVPREDENVKKEREKEELTASLRKCTRNVTVQAVMR